MKRFTVVIFLLSVGISLFAQTNMAAIDQVFQQLYRMADGAEVQGFTWNGNLGTKKLDGIPYVHAADVQIERSSTYPIVAYTLEGSWDVLSQLFNDYTRYIISKGGTVVPDATVSITGIDLKGWVVGRYFVTMMFIYDRERVQNKGFHELHVGVKRL